MYSRWVGISKWEWDINIYFETFWTILRMRINKAYLLNSFKLNNCSVSSVLFSLIEIQHYSPILSGSVKCDVKTYNKAGTGTRTRRYRSRCKFSNWVMEIIPYACRNQWHKIILHNFKIIYNFFHIYLSFWYWIMFVLTQHYASLLSSPKLRW